MGRDSSEFLVFWTCFQAFPFPNWCIFVNGIRFKLSTKNRIKPVKPLKHTWKCVGLLKTVTTVIHTACRLCFLLCSRHKRQLNIKIKWYWWNYRNKDKMWQTKINFIWFINLFHKNHTAFGLKIPNPPIGGCGLDTDDTITSRLQRILWHIWASPLFSTDRRICLSQLTSVSHTACRLVKKHLSPRGHIITLTSSIGLILWLHIIA